MNPEVLATVVTSGLAAGAAVDYAAVRSSAKRIRSFDSIHNLASGAYSDFSLNKKSRRGLFGRIAARTLMAVSGAGLAYGSFMFLSHGNIRVAPPKQTVGVILDGTAGPLNDGSFSSMQRFTENAFSRDRNVNGVIAEADHTEAVSGFRSQELSRFSQYIGGPESALIDATQTAVDNATNSKNENALVVVTNNDAVGTVSQIQQVEQSGQHPVRLYVVNTSGCTPGSELESVALSTGGKCLPMNNPAALSDIQSLANPKVEPHSLPDHSLDWPWLSVAAGGLVIDVAGFSLRSQGILPLSVNPTGI